VKTHTLPLPTKLYTADQVRVLDRCAVEEHHLNTSLLMMRAGKAAFTQLLALWPQVVSIHVFCGSGNNGGDGYVLAALASQQQLSVIVWQLAPVEKLTGAALAAYHYAQQEQVLIQPFSLAAWQQQQLLTPATLTQSVVIIDALLGTGLTGPVRPLYADAIESINACDWPVLALDIPSGVNADTGDVTGVAIKANATVSFIGLKLGLFMSRGRVFSGQRYFNDLAVPISIYSAASAIATRLQLDDVLGVLAPRPADAHKKDCGHLLVIGGDHGYGGAPLMAAEMALRCGAGMVSIATHAEHIGAILARRPELMALAVESGQILKPLLQRSNALVVGPGMGSSAWSKQLLSHAIGVGLPMVIDADALNLLASGDLHLNTDNPQWILTPHPGEAARLLATTSDRIQADRVQAARDIQARYGGVVILKGPGTLVLDLDGNISVCDHGNPGMASAGMGDVLCGLLGALIVQGVGLNNAAQLGVCLHAAAADNLVQNNGERGLLATDLIAAVRTIINGPRISDSRR
jgi:ADP-dependent NAD(P)H-hydrate dehydratase / NAD(P)H-hydrate epimerase